MQRLAGRVGGGDETVGRPDALEPQQLQKRPVQPPPGPSSHGSPVQIHGKLRVPAEGRPLRLAVGVGVAQDIPGLLPDQIGVEGQDVPHPGLELRRGRQVIFKGNGGVDILGVDVQQRRGIGLPGQTKGPHGVLLQSSE